ncbi:MAG: acetyltransferase [Phycisphaeraceae bacterium]|nr:acetyltransferase [Phycisphaeraceae bacterium]MCW5754361.1 acetyltransferase [Phycisphaeraceae bacterium]
MREWRTNSKGALLIVGGGGHALVVAETALLSGYALAGVLDDAENPAATRPPFEAHRLGPLIDTAQAQSRSWILAIGDPSQRKSLLEGSWAAIPGALTLVHPKAVISSTADLAEGVWVGPGAVIHTAAQIGPHAIINTGAIVEHEVRIGSCTHIAPGAILAGRVTVGNAALIGIGAKVLPGVSIGNEAIVGAGAVVTRDVPDGATVVGIPARNSSA